MSAVRPGLVLCALGVWMSERSDGRSIEREGPTGMRSSWSVSKVEMMQGHAPADPTGAELEGPRPALKTGC